MTAFADHNSRKMRDSWEYVKLGDYFDILTGFPFKSELFSNNPPGIKLVRGDNITSGYLRWGEKTRYWRNVTKDLEKYLLKQNDILISMDGSLVGKNFAKINESELPLLLVQRVARLRVKNNVSPDFAFQYIRSEFPKYVKKVRTVSAIPHISPNDIHDFTIPLIPSVEQRRIATILTTVDDAIQRSRQAGAETERLKAGVMHELMTKGIEHTEFREDPDVGMVPEGWEVKPLGEICTVKTGPFGAQLHMSDYVANGTPIITVEHLGDLGIIHENLPLVSDSDKARLKEYHLKEGDIVFSRVGSVDRSCYISKKEAGWLFSGRLLRVRPVTKELLPTYLNYYFSFEGFKHRIRSASVGGTMANLNTTIMSQIKIIFPSLHEQQQITTLLSAIDGKITLQRQRTTHYEHLKQGLMNELLTGKRRVAVT